MRRYRSFVALLATVFLTSSAAAQTPNVAAVFALHAFTAPSEPWPYYCPGTQYSGDPVTNGIPCSNYVTVRPANSANWVYVVVGHGDAGIDGVSFGVAYDGIYEPGYLDALSWTVCSDGMAFPSENPAWPASGSGIRLTWDTCQGTVAGNDGIQAVVAKFYMYAYEGAHFEVTPNFTTGDAPELNVNTCGQGTTRLLEQYGESLWGVLTGRVDFGGGYGLNPCLNGLPAEPSTWGRIKKRFTGPGR